MVSQHKVHRLICKLYDRPAAVKNSRQSFMDMWVKNIKCTKYTVVESILLKAGLATFYWRDTICKGRLSLDSINVWLMTVFSPTTVKHRVVLPPPFFSHLKERRVFSCDFDFEPNRSGIKNLQRISNPNLSLQLPPHWQESCPSQRTPPIFPPHRPLSEKWPQTCGWWVRSGTSGWSSPK